MCAGEGANGLCPGGAHAPTGCRKMNNEKRCLANAPRLGRRAVVRSSSAHRNFFSRRESYSSSCYYFFPRYIFLPPQKRGKSLVCPVPRAVRPCRFKPIVIPKKVSCDGAAAEAPHRHFYSYSFRVCPGGSAARGLRRIIYFWLSRSLRIVERSARAFPLLSPAWEGPNGGSGKKTHICKRRKTAFVARSHYEILKKKILHSSIWPGRMWKVYTCGFFGILLESTKPTKNGSLSLPLLSAGVLAPNPPKERWVQRFMWRPFPPNIPLLCSSVLHCTVNVLCWREAGKGRKRELKKPLRTKI